MCTLLSAIYRQGYRNFEVIVVDDCSTDASVTTIRERYPAVKIFVNPTNSGPCVTRNRGVCEATGDVIVGLDSDVTVPDVELFDKIVDAYQAHPKATGFAFRIHAADGHADDEPRWWHPIPIERGKSQLFESDYFSGTAYSFRRTEMIAAGLFRPLYYMHYEEVELAYRILDQGGTILYNPELTATHHESKVAKRSRVQQFYKPRNQIILAATCFSKKKAFQFLFPRMGYQFCKALAGRHIHTFGAALWDAAKTLRRIGPNRSPLHQETLHRISELRRA